LLKQECKKEEVWEMIEHFAQNIPFITKFNSATPVVQKQLRAIFRRAHELRLDWYFTDIPDLRCGRKEIMRVRAASVCFLIRFRNQDPFLTHSARIGLANRQMPLGHDDRGILYHHIEGFAGENVATRPLGGFWPDHYLASDAQFKFDKKIAKSLEDEREARLGRLANAQPFPRRREVPRIVFDRNPDVVAEMLYLASGKCQRCNNRAPFKKHPSGEPFLEVHHITPLAEDGPDTVENAIALCPNCHRELHYGDPALRNLANGH